jgi:hypothetical protein
MSLIRSLQGDVAALATNAGRMVGTPGHEAAVSYLLGRMAELGLEDYGGSFTHAYRVGKTHFTNLVGQLLGSDQNLPPVLLGAHYDTCGALPGADDNAAAVAILLAVAERLAWRGLERPLLFAFFDAEEPPFFLGPAMGSTYFYHHHRTEEIHGALILDLVGHDVPVPGLEDLLFLTGMESDPKLPDVLNRCTSAQGIRTVASLNRYVGDMSDHHVFRINRRPYLFLTCGRWAHYHGASDTPEKLNYQKMAAVTEYLAELSVAVAETPLEGPFEGYDSTAAELHSMRNAIGPFARTLGIALATRQDIERAVAHFMGHFRL